MLYSYAALLKYIARMDPIRINSGGDRNPGAVGQCREFPVIFIKAGRNELLGEIHVFTVRAAGQTTYGCRMAPSL